MIGDNGYVSWCVVSCAKDSSDPRMTSGIATEEIAEKYADAIRQEGYQVILIAEASEFLSFGRNAIPERCRECGQGEKPCPCDPAFMA